MLIHWLWISHQTHFKKGITQGLSASWLLYIANCFRRVKRYFVKLKPNLYIHDKNYHNSKETPFHYHVATNFKLITIKTNPFLQFKDISIFSKQKISWKEVGTAGNMTERAPPKQNPRKVWFNLSNKIQRFSNICSNWPNFQLFFTNRQKWKIFPKKI